MPDIFPQPYDGYVPMRITQPSGFKDLLLDAYVLDDVAGRPAVLLSGCVGKTGNTWYRPLLTKNQLSRMLEKIEQREDELRAEGLHF